MRIAPPWTLAATWFSMATFAIAGGLVGCSEAPSTIVLGEGVGACVVAQCPGEDTECRARACVDGACAMVDVASGIAAKNQVRGDCQIQVCDGKGALTRIADDSDTPDDNNDCTSNRCSGGRPVFDNLPATQSCGVNAKLRCNGQGACVGCNAATECTGTTECSTATCNAGQCGLTYAAAGTPSAAQTAGDCVQNACDGMGVLKATNYDSDVPTTTNPCVTVGCSMGSITSTNKSDGTSCNTGGKVCKTGTCVACIVNSDCGTTTECRTFVCLANNTCQSSQRPNGFVLASQTSGDCKVRVCDSNGNVAVNTNTSDIPFDNNMCTEDRCTGQTPSNPFLSIGTLCNGGNNSCDGAGACVCSPEGVCP